MNVLVDRQLLAIALRHAAQAGDATAPLDRVHLAATGDGLALDVRGRAIRIRARLTAAVDAPGEIVTDCAGLGKAARAMTTSFVRIERQPADRPASADRVRVHAGTVEARLPVFDPDESRLFPGDVGATLATLPGLRGALTRLSLSMAAEDNRYGLSCVRIDPGATPGDPPVGVTTDGNRMLIEDLPGGELASAFSLPSAAARAIATVPAKLAPTGSVIVHALDDRWAEGVCGAILIAFHRPEGDFVAWRQVVPTESSGIVVRIDRDALARAATVCAMFASDPMRTTLVELVDGELILRAWAEGREIRETVPVEADGPVPLMGLNARFLAEYAGASRPGMLALRVRGRLQPVTWSTGRGRAVLMPLRIDDARELRRRPC